MPNRDCMVLTNVLLIVTDADYYYNCVKSPAKHMANRNKHNDTPNGRSNLETDVTQTEGKR